MRIARAKDRGSNNEAILNEGVLEQVAREKVKKKRNKKVVGTDKISVMGWKVRVFFVT